MRFLCVARAPGRSIDARCVRCPQNTARAISCLSFQGMDGENDKLLNRAAVICLSNQDLNVENDKLLNQSNVET